MGVVLGALAVFLPGLAFWIWLGPSEDDAGQVLAKSIGYSVALAAVGALALAALRISLSPAMIAVIWVLVGALCLVGLMRRAAWPAWTSWLGALIGLGILIAWRFWQARQLVLPNWTDSLHHTLIVRKFMETGRLPTSLEPYLPITFYYHYAFHSITALFATLAGIDAPQAVLVFGNLLLAGASLSVYALARELSNKVWVGVAAGAISAFALRMPGYYLTWGRYTLLAGMLLLPLTIAEAQAALNGRRNIWQAAGLGLLFAGTVLGHYFMVLLLGLYLALAGLNWLISGLWTRKLNLAALFSFIGPLALAGLGLLPWFLRVRELSAGITNTTPLRTEATDLAAQWPYLGQLLGPGLGVVLSILALTGAIFCLLDAQKRGFGLWALATGILALPTGIYLVSFRSDYFAMTLYLPVAVCLALFGAWLYDKLANVLPDRLTFSAIAQAAVLVLFFYAAGQNADPINAQTVLVNQADRDALSWVQDHLPQDGRFFVNTAQWGWGYQRGVDGGGWLLPYTGNWSLAPTIFYGQSHDRDLVKLWQDWGLRAAKVSACETDFWELVAEADLDYVYAREGSGSLQPIVLDQCSGLERLYKSDGVGIWLIKARH